jgi:hypothetical protein
MLEREVYCADLDMCFKNSLDASIKTGVCRSSILKACSGNRASAGGMLWCYSNEQDKLKNYLKHYAV